MTRIQEYQRLMNSSIKSLRNIRDYISLQINEVQVCVYSVSIYFQGLAACVVRKNSTQPVAVGFLTL